MTTLGLIALALILGALGRYPAAWVWNKWQQDNEDY